MFSFQAFYFQMFSKAYYDKSEGGSPILAMVQTTWQTQSPCLPGPAPSDTISIAHQKGARGSMLEGKNVGTK